MAAVAVGLLWPAGARAQDDALISGGIGYFDFDDDDDAVDFRLEYRGGRKFFGFVKPWLGAEATSEGALFGVGGIHADFALGDHFVLTPSFGAGLYHEGGGKDLGNTVQFRSQLELGYQWDSGHRLSLAISHISNASLGDDNPGAEIISVYYHVPVRLLFGR